MSSDASSGPHPPQVSELRRSRIIAGAVVLAFVGAVMPIAAVLYASWSFAIKAEQHRLATLAGRAISRADLSIAEARQILLTMEASQLPACSPAHIAHMRRLAFGSRTIEEVGYFHDGVLQCTSWGVFEAGTRRAPADYILPGGLGVTLRMRSAVYPDKEMMALGRGAYNVLIDPLRLVDIIIDPGVGLALATRDGPLVAQLNVPDTALVHEIMAHADNGLDDAHLFGMAQRGDWTAVALMPRSEMLQGLRQQQLTLLPIGAIGALCLIAGVIWLSRRRLSPLAELALAVRNREFVVHYQPVVELRSGACIGVEALVRWHRPDGSRVRPDLFVPLAEESGLILPITDQVIDCIVADLAPLLAADPALHVAINLCADDLRTGRVLAVIRTALEGTGIRMEQIWLEATERGFLHIEAARSTIARARKAGHIVAIDDFGTGYSSLQYLQSLPLDALKIDKSFVSTIDRDAATSTVTAHIIDMAKTLGLRIVAEGIEEKGQLDYLLAHDVDYGQGWLFARPMPGPEFATFHARNRARCGVPLLSFPNTTPVEATS
ncbi:cyclic diguanylate phosphodiesterase [Azorhizobium oxalatiphilum]|uniref:cyclic-guanylate-specific phosphodiesterase n=1 Tax=Azorhizobium oxalatiphilum TaxID=980631 RepID=A0A917F345_9HYPH|nr:EAL domain-containing protein [Azorhizobium oxalatiphilum]GGF48100.1 cyclic diguanylate phosphodiesterase [Azorhizobium oxalatiphilum]